MREKKSILFVRPDYHCSFFHRDEFRNQGWKADIFVPHKYPVNFLYSDKDILRSPAINLKNNLSKKFVNHALLIVWWLSVFWKYEHHVYYGRSPVITFCEERLGLTKLFGKDFLVELWLAKLFSIKLIYVPSGCHEEELKTNYMRLDDGNICNNCGFFNLCDDDKNNLNFMRVRRYFDMIIGPGSVDSSQYLATNLAYKAIDLNLWNPSIKIPPEHTLPQSENIRVLHTHVLKVSGRNWKGRNIKGSPYVLEAVQRLKEEGLPIELIDLAFVPSHHMRFYQAQADIVVEQLIYGSYGSTGVEAMALGKPVICYLRNSWKKHFYNSLPDIETLPIIEATTDNIYDVIKKLATDKKYRVKAGADSRRFAEMHFDPVKNSKALINILEQN